MSKTTLVTVLAALLLPLVTANGAAASPSTTTIRGIVVDGTAVLTPEVGSLVIPRDLHPVAGARVFLLDQGIESVTGRDGRFSFTGLATAAPYSKMTVRVSAEGFGDWEVRGAAVPSGGNALGLYVELLPYSQVVEETPREEEPSDALRESTQWVTGLSPLSSCSGFYSNHWPPPVIKVWRRSIGEQFVRTYDFKFYLKHVLGKEWGPTWHPNSLRAGAVAVENYGWYWVNNWRGGVAPNGACYDVDDTTLYQVFEPGVSWASTDEAVNTAWNFLVKKSGTIFEGSYFSGDPGENCGYAANGWQMRQWGTKTCADQGMGWKDLVHTYYYNPPVTFQFIKVDFGGDGCADVLSTKSDGTIWLTRGDCAEGWLQWSPGVWSKAIGSEWQVYNRVLGPGDFSGDGCADVLSTKSDGTIWLTRGNCGDSWLQYPDGSWAKAIGADWQFYNRIIGPGDFSGDGCADVLSTKSDGTIWLTRGNCAEGWLQYPDGSWAKAIGADWQFYNRVF